jgi:hypothetical protein
MKKINQFVSENYGFLFIVGYCVWTFNWIAVIGWGLALWGQWYKDELMDIIQDDTTQIQKWHKKYMDAKYPKK